MYTAKDVQETLNCSKSTAYKLMNLHSFPSFRIGKNLYVLPEDLKKFLSQSKGKTITI